MKRISMIFLGLLIVAGLSAQYNSVVNKYLFYGGLKIGKTTLTGTKPNWANKTGSLLVPIDSGTTNNVSTPTLIKFYSGATQLNPDIPAAFQIDAKTVQPMNSDTGLVSITFGYGSGAAIDTTNIGLTSDFGGWFNDGSDTVVITKVIGIVKDSKRAATIPINIYHHATYFYATPDSVCDDHLVVTSTTTGTSTTTMEAKVAILPGEWVWCSPAHSLPVNGTIPSKLRVVASGHKQNRKY